MFIYPRWNINPADWRQYVLPLGLLALAAGLTILARQNRGPLAAFLIFLGTLFPVLGFLNVYPFRYSWVADHFEYLAALAIIIPAAAGLTILTARFSPGKFVGIALPALLLGMLGFASWRQSGFYRDYETLVRETLARNPASPFLHGNLGVQLMLHPEGIPEAVSEFQKAVRLQPDSAVFHDNLGLALASMPGRQQEAIAEYQTALRLNPHLQAAHLNLGLALMSMPGRQQDAIAEYQKAIAEYQTTAGTEPDFWQPHLNLGIAYAQIPGRQADAIAEFQIALRMKPDSVLAHFHLGNSYQAEGRLEEAIDQYRAAMRIDPSATDVRYELAYALARIPGRVPEAVAECQELLRISPNDGPGRELMASLVAFQNQRQIP
jgi:tetratricopeptide (TPR) repeat protein